MSGNVGMWSHQPITTPDPNIKAGLGTTCLRERSALSLVKTELLQNGIRRWNWVRSQDRMVLIVFSPRRVSFQRHTRSVACACAMIMETANQAILQAPSSLSKDLIRSRLRRCFLGFFMTGRGSGIVVVCAAYVILTGNEWSHCYKQVGHKITQSGFVVWWGFVGWTWYIPCLSCLLKAWSCRRKSKRRTCLRLLLLADCWDSGEYRSVDFESKTSLVVTRSSLC